MARLHRRQFLKRSAALASLAYCAQIVPSRGETAQSKLNIAAIGVGGRGRANLDGVKDENIVALCDVDANNLAEAAKLFPRAKLYRDFRRMLDEMGNSIDAVVVSTPDHTHAPAAAAAMKLGKHCYCEKPLTHCVYEARYLAELAAEKKVVTQIGTQIHAGDNYRRVVEWVQAGVIGPIQEVHVWCAASYSGGDTPKDTPPVPPYLDWDLWLGPAPYRPYHPAYVPFRWRGWKDFGSGALGDFFCHYSDLAFWALGLKYPTSVEAEGPPPHPDSTPPWLIVRYEFPARGELPPVRLTWYDGGKRPPIQAEVKLPGWASGVLFVGEKGMILADYGRRLLWPEEKFAGFQPPPETIPPSIGHHREWVEACKTGGTTTCHFGYSGPLTEAALLGMVAFRVGQKINWDPVNLKAINCPEADIWIKKPYREGWSL